MTLGLAGLRLHQTEPQLTGPMDLKASEVSVVVPVRNNTSGLIRLLEAIANLDHDSQPGEVIVVDDGSRPQVPMEALRSSSDGLCIRIVRMRGTGPGVARNAGAALARGRWLLFTDSDCVPCSGWVMGYKSAMNGAIAYAGGVRALHNDFLSRYCEAQELLIPPPCADLRPLYLVTANALVLREAFVRVRGFDPHFAIAGGEDIDFALRMRKIGDLCFALNSVVFHDFSGGIRTFLRRCIRYGIGNRMLANKYGLDLAPQRFRPALKGWRATLAAHLQFVGLWVGYHMAAGARS
ncbi:MAG: glycosyltransferase [Calditrichaeota bacterium]|nr:MAG: glycosyltransferase [Calditrichota bacterium]